ncbi:DUF4091 domain-containing protein [Hyalangium minutum]|uniref:Glycoside hydrolase 123 catalytic domain-containing protein n=1 Tax=Hyalangium minutum TaxID=394096 RepID=A0A085WAA8_9BACT|nr:DUF4091 domain-containing protein [Hyalangium minutum]KFE64621.1 hypothetical protein DB31_1639 [Hyalangium minutum]
MGAGWAWVVMAALAASPGPKVVSPLVKVRPGVTLKGSTEAQLSLARGECEGTQVVLPGNVRQVTAKPLTLKGPGSALSASLWREGFIEVKTPSNSMGAKGFWPDPLLPVNVPGDPKLPAVLYVEVCAPTEQKPGTYRGELSVKADDGAVAPVPFTVEVQPFALPATSSLPTSFGISLYSIARGHKLAPESPEAMTLLRAYGKALLQHRLSAYGMSMNAPPVRFEDGRAVVDFSAYDEEMAPFFEGTALPSGARFTTADVRDSSQCKTEQEKVAYYRAFAEHFRSKGWSAQLFFYAKDEPKPEEMALVRTQASRVKAAGKDIPVLVTSALHDGIQSSADILAPTLNCFFPRWELETCPNVVPLSKLRSKLRSGTRVWWYQSCNSHGCTGGPAEDPAVERAYTGWASYMVDHPAPLNRSMGPLAFLTGVDGELYFDTVYAYNTQDPWQGVFEFGGNGDGTLFYPGTPERLGTKEPQPVVSLRLKHIRDGLEDYEYLHLLARLGDAEPARAFARRLARSGYEIEQNVATWEQVRHNLTAQLRKRWDASEYAKRPGVRR